MLEFALKSTFDGSLQPSLFFHPGGETPVPLVVGLHTWKGNCRDQQDNYLPLCRQRGWALLLPDFRGPCLASNPNPLAACGSAAAIQDVFDAISVVTRQYPINPALIFMLGSSGGGQMALLTAAHNPRLFRAVDVWGPVTDLVQWHRFSQENQLEYHQHLEVCLGGPPGAVPQRYRQRSPAYQLKMLEGLCLSVHHGKDDPIVPYAHSLRFVQELEKITPQTIFFEFFQGGHEQHPERSFAWFEQLAATPPDNA